MSDHGPFRPLRPYAETDRSMFFGRDRELSQLLDILALERPSALLLGESGVGKSSLVRAGLLPTLRARGVSCTYVDCTRFDEMVTPTHASAGTLLVLDDVGVLLDGNRELERLLGYLARVGQTPDLKILFVIDDAELARLDDLDRKIGHVGPLAARLHLGRFDEGRAADVIERTVLGGGSYFEAGLSQQIADDLTSDGPTSPSELQVVAAGAMRLRLNSLAAYRAAGGAGAVAWRFFDSVCDRAGGLLAKRVLAEVAALEAREAASLEHLLRATGADASQVDQVLNVLSQEAVVRRLGDVCVLASEWSRPLLRAFTGEVRARSVGVRLLLRQKAARGLLGPRELAAVRRWGGTLDPDESRAVARTRRVYAAAAVAAAAAPIAGLVLAYKSQTGSCYFDAAAAPGAPVVVRLGRPGGRFLPLPHRPAFGAVVADTGFARAALAAGLPDGTTAWGGDAWLRVLVAALEPLPRAAASLVLEGDAAPLAKAYEEAALRPAVLSLIGAAGAGAPGELSLIEAALGDGAEEVRRRAVEAAAALEARAPGSGAALLGRGLKDAAPSVRALALDRIAKMPEAQAAPLYAAALAAAHDPVVERQALEALARLATRTPSAAAALASALSGPGRAEAARLLNRMLDGEEAAAEAAAAALAAVALDANAAEEARIEALRLLRRRGKPVEGVAGVTGSPKLTAAAMPLVLLGSPEEAAARVAEAMRGAVPLRAAAAAAIGLLPRGPDTAQKLKVLGYDGAVEVRAEAVRALPVLGREALPQLTKELRDGGAVVERAAVETLAANAGKLGAASVVGMLENAARTGRASTKRAAIEALGHIAEQKPQAATPALGRLLHDKAPEVRGEAARALGELLAAAGAADKQAAAREAIGALRGAARDPDGALRRRAAEALGNAKGAAAPLAARALGAFTGDADPAVRAAAGDGLAALGAQAKEAAPPLAALVGDKDAAVRAAGRRAAQAFGTAAGDLDKVLLASLAQASPADRADIAATAGKTGAAATVRAALADEAAVVRRAAAEHAGGLGGPAAEALAAALGDGDAAVRLAAVKGLVGARAAGALVAACHSPDREVRLEALVALGRVGGDEARRALEAALGDPSERVRLAAVRGLALIGRDAGELLARALADGARDVREAAVEGLGFAWSSLPASELAVRLADETDADRRWAATLALVHQGKGDTASEAKAALERAAADGSPAVRLSARAGLRTFARPAHLLTLLAALRSG